MSENDLIRYIRGCVPSDITEHYLAGDFSEALRLCGIRLSGEDTAPEVKNGIMMLRHLIKVCIGEFCLEEKTVLEQIQRENPGFTQEELRGLIDSGYLQNRLIGGKRMFFSRAAASVLKGLPSAGGKGLVPLEDNPRDMAREHMKKNGSMTVRNRILSRISLTQEAFTPGEVLTVHLPLPRENEYQSDIVIEKILPEGAAVSPAGSLNRTVCWKDSPKENTVYSVEYSYSCTERYTDTFASGGSRCPEEDISEYLGEEEPQIVFSPLVKMVTERVTAGIADPIKKARAIYDYITLNMKYSYMPHYILIPDIVDECLRNLRGDCGVFALTMITMLRCAGIPSRWQSGLAAGPENAGCHDWLLFYTPSHGWLPADPSYGTGAVRDGSEERRKFYFGNIDPWRMIANDAFLGDFDVKKKFFSIDPYDNQLGEIESLSKGFLSSEVDASHELIASGIIS